VNFDPVAIGKALSDAGGWAAFLVVVIVIAVGSMRRLRWWVPGWIYDDERNNRTISDTQSQRTTAALEELARAFRQMTNDLAAMARTDESLRGELADLRRRLDRLSRD
jgi:predicted MFS family arabinose efflux permease